MSTCDYFRLTLEMKIGKSPMQSIQITSKEQLRVQLIQVKQTYLSYL